jgi:hypothetical protein
MFHMFTDVHKYASGIRNLILGFFVSIFTVMETFFISVLSISFYVVSSWYSVSYDYWIVIQLFKKYPVKEKLNLNHYSTKACNQPYLGKGSYLCKLS